MGTRNLIQFICKSSKCSEAKPALQIHFWIFKASYSHTTLTYVVSSLTVKAQKGYTVSKPVLLITMIKAKMQRQKLAKEKATDQLTS